MYFSIYPTRIKDSTVVGHLCPGAAGEQPLQDKEDVPPPAPLPWPFPTALLADRRDEAFLQYVTILTLTLLPSALYLLLAPVERIHPGHALVHALYTVYNIRKYMLMLHCTSHRRLFRKPWGVLNHWVPVVGWFTGQTINSYYCHHVKVGGAWCGGVWRGVARA